LVGIVGDFSDPTNERIIYLSAAGLALVGLGLLLATIVWWRRGRQEHPSLAPLEVMSGRAWAKAPAGDRRRRLDHVRPEGATANAAEEEIVRSEPLDLEALVRSTPQAFDDLREPGEPSVDEAEPTEQPVAAEHSDMEAVEADAVEVEAVEPAQATEATAPEAEPAPEPVAPKPAPPVADADATSVATQRPAQSVDVLASGPSDPAS
jgi:hypothetical protein